MAFLQDAGFQEWVPNNQVTLADERELTRNKLLLDVGLRKERQARDEQNEHARLH